MKNFRNFIKLKKKIFRFKKRWWFARHGNKNSGEQKFQNKPRKNETVQQTDAEQKPTG